MGWEADKRAADRYMPAVKRILGEYLITEAAQEEDRERNTDLIVLTLAGVRVAVRIRTHDYLRRYPGEFTIREARPNGNQTELAKVVSGWGDFMFYGFAAEQGDGLAQWVLLDLKVFRLWWSQRLAKGAAGWLPGIRCKNKDDSSDFRAFRLADLPPALVLAQGATCPT